MCDYCGCRARALLERLGRDHERIMAVARRLRSSFDVDDATDRMHHARELQRLLETHDRIEESGLYPELDRAGVPTAHMQAEHGAVDGALHAAADPGPVEPDRVIRALDVLEEHIRREEYDLFPAAHQLIDDAGWDRIDGSAAGGEA